MDVIHEYDETGALEWMSTHPSHKTRQEKLEEQLPDAINLRKYCKVRTFSLSAIFTILRCICLFKCSVLNFHEGILAMISKTFVGRYPMCNRSPCPLEFFWTCLILFLPLLREICSNICFVHCMSLS